MKFLGDRPNDSTIFFLWSTSSKTGASITRATDGTVKVRRDDGTTITTGITDNEDTPLTGIHECKIDTSAHVDYTVGSSFEVYLDGAVIDGETVNAVLANFTLNNGARIIPAGYLGDYKYWTDSVYVPFFTTDGIGNPVAFTAGTWEVYKDSNPTGKQSGHVLTTPATGWDGVGGLHVLRVDLDNAFFERGIIYTVVAKAATINGLTINGIIGTFTIEKQNQLSSILATTVSTQNTASSFTLAAGKASADAFKNKFVMIEDADDNNREIRRITGWTAGLIATVDRAFSFTPAVSDIVWIGNYNDMRGTDSANTTVPDVAGTAAGLHATTDGLITGLENLSQAESQSAATAALNAYDPPTRTEATADKVEIIAEVDDNEVKIDTSITNQTTINNNVLANLAAIGALNDPTVADIADGVLLELVADHSGTAGSLAAILDLIKKISEADTEVDTSDDTQWVVVFKEKGTSTEIMRKNMLDINGAAVTATSAVVGANTHTT